MKKKLITLFIFAILLSVVAVDASDKQPPRRDRSGTLSVITTGLGPYDDVDNLGEEAGLLSFSVLPEFRAKSRCCPLCWISSCCLAAGRGLTRIMNCVPCLGDGKEDDE